MNMPKTMRALVVSLFLLPLTLISTASLRAQTAESLKSPASVIRNLYRAHHNGGGHLFEARGRLKLYKFFDTQLADLIWKDIHDTPEGEVGNLGFDPLYNAQDTEITQFQIGSPAMEGDNAIVVVSFKNFGQLTRLKFLMVKRKQAWKIANVDYGDDSNLIKILSPSN